jgi:hypothetical protein
MLPPMMSPTYRTILIDEMNRLLVILRTLLACEAALDYRSCGRDVDYEPTALTILAKYFRLHD